MSRGPTAKASPLASAVTEATVGDAAFPKVVSLRPVLSGSRSISCWTRPAAVLFAAAPKFRCSWRWGEAQMPRARRDAVMRHGTDGAHRIGSYCWPVTGFVRIGAIGTPGVIEYAAAFCKRWATGTT